MASTFRHKIAILDSWVDIPPLDHDAELVQYTNSTEEEVIERIRDATIVIASGTPVSAAAIESSTRLQLIAINGVGVNHVDKEAARRKGVCICNVPGQNAASVSEHAFALYFAVNRRIVELHQLTVQGIAWAEEDALHPRIVPVPRTAAEQTLVIVGYGTLGRNIERIGRALGMKILIAERKGARTVREGRTAFDDCLQHGTVFILSMPSDESTLNTFSHREFGMMDPTSLLINVGRGEAINERALIEALHAGMIAGAATDVFKQEPATKANTALLDPSIPNLVLSPHVAWYATTTIKGTFAIMKSNLDGFMSGNPQNLVLDSRIEPKN